MVETRTLKCFALQTYPFGQWCLVGWLMFFLFIFYAIFRKFARTRILCLLYVCRIVLLYMVSYSFSLLVFALKIQQHINVCVYTMCSLLSYSTRCSLGYKIAFCYQNICDAECIRFLQF